MKFYILFLTILTACCTLSAQPRDQNSELPVYVHPVLIDDEESLHVNNALTPWDTTPALNWDLIKTLIIQNRIRRINKIIEDNPKILRERDHLGRNILLLAAELDRLQIIINLIEKHEMPITSVDSTRRNIAHIAIQHGYVNITRWIYNNYPLLLMRPNAFDQTPAEIYQFLYGDS